MTRITQVQNFMKQVGSENVADLIVGCDCLCELIGELPPFERRKLHRQLKRALEDEDRGLPFAAKFLLEIIANNIPQQWSDLYTRKDSEPDQ